MRKVLIMFVVAALVVGRPSYSRAQNNPGIEFSLAISAAAADLVYTPAKVVVAIGGLALGAITGFLTGGDTRSAYAIWVPAASGTYILTASHLEGTIPIEFFGSDYADRPSAPSTAAMEAGGIYEAQYSK
jgi:hypothetical protein